MAEENKYYVVRGAKMKCKCGSHKRKINLPVSHGSYVDEKPMMNEDDNKAVVNVTYFGVCKSGSNPSSQIVNLVGEDGATITGKLCCPKIIGKWMKTKEKTKVEGKPPLTTESQLVCGFDGLITFVTNGQEDKE